MEATVKARTEASVETIMEPVEAMMKSVAPVKHEDATSKKPRASPVIPRISIVGVAVIGIAYIRIVAIAAGRRALHSIAV
jgi:hypothetical protein